MCQCVFPHAVIALAAGLLIKDLIEAIQLLQRLGLAHLSMDRSATSLSTGKLQRAQSRNTLYLFDEPTTGLHPADTDKLLKLLQALVDAGSSVIVVEHDMQVVAECDWVIDLGPGAGADGGTVVAASPPQEVAGSNASRTAQYLRKTRG